MEPTTATPDMTLLLEIEHEGNWIPAWSCDEKDRPGECSLASLIEANDHDEGAADFIDPVSALAVGESFTYNGGAGGLTRFTRRA